MPRNFAAALARVLSLVRSKAPAMKNAFHALFALALILGLASSFSPTFIETATVALPLAQRRPAFAGLAEPSAHATARAASQSGSWALLAHQSGCGR